MLYIANLIIVLVWCCYILKKEKYSWHGIIGVYFLALCVVDIPEIIFNRFLRVYNFSIQLFNNFEDNNRLGLVISDGVILPLAAIIFCHFAVKKPNHYWILAFIFTFLWHVPLELLYLKFDYLIYKRWSLLYSTLIYLFAFRFFAQHAKRILTYVPPIPYFITIGTVVYGITAWIGALLGGALFHLYQWRPHIFEYSGADDRFLELGLSWLASILSAILIPKLNLKYRPYVFIGLAALIIAFCYWANGKGWLIYHNWNHLFTALRWIVPFIIIIRYDQWETKFRG